METLLRSKDRKVTNAVSPNGKTPTIANTFGLPSGKNYSCPNATSICEKICYAGKLEKIYKGVRENLLHNWNLLKHADRITMVELLDQMINEFISDCDKRNAEKKFRIHWDGDFFSEEYTEAWRLVITKHSDVQFWVYTRVPSAIKILQKTLLTNLSLYFSTDDENKEEAENLLDYSVYGFRIAYLSDTFEEGMEHVKSLTGKPGAKCPEQLKSIPLISDKGGACFTCGLCIDGKSDIRFSISKK